jgi:uncharacterized DUF497 family protein
MRRLRAEWDPREDQSNRSKHGLGFDEVRALFEGQQNYPVIYDAEHSGDEDRFVAIGAMWRGVVVVVHTEPAEDVIRIISARLATPAEEVLFRKHVEGRKR